MDPNVTPDMPVAGASTAPVLPYATPLGYQPAGLWRDGRQLVAHRNVVYPDRCVKCNGPAEGKRWSKKLWWHHPALYFLILFPGLLIYAIVAICVRKSVQVSVGLCPRHRAIRRNAILVGWLCGLAGLTGLFVGVFLLSDRQYEDTPLPPILILGGLGLAFFGLLWGNFRARVLLPKRIDGEYAWFTGASAEYLAELPPARPLV